LDFFHNALYGSETAECGHHLKSGIR
jgi:hypothetical protein